MSEILGLKPVRKIGITSRSVSGTVPQFGRYESTLERDLMEILRFDRGVESYVPQPVTIDYVATGGKVYPYTPDGLIRFSPELHEPPVLVEVKYREDFRKDWKTLMLKFRAAKQFSLMQGWRFEVLTEREIRTPYLENARFLYQYLERIPVESVKVQMLQVLGDLNEADPALLLCALKADADERARLIPVLWHLVATGTIGCDLDAPLTMKSLIWLGEES